MIYNFPQIIENSAKRFPKRDAFRCGNDSINYEDLNQKTSQLAQFFIENGIKKGDRVGIYLNRCLDTALAIYGVMKAGAIYVPIDTTAPIERVHFVIKDCGIQFLISNKTQKRKLQQIINGEVQLKNIVGLSADWEVPTTSWETIFSKNKTFTPIRILESDPAYIIYTSGSTGIPKGILHTHHSGLAYAKLTADLYQLNEHDRIANHAPLHFDISTLGFFTSPLVGATTVIIPEAYTRLPASLAMLMEKEKLTVWYSVPLALVQVLQQGVIEQKDFSTLRWILYGGEPFPLKYLKAWMNILPQATFSNVYGPAEVNQCTYYNFQKLSAEEESVPLGQVWGNSDFLILDENENSTTEGEIGELLIRSATRMAGYWNQPELTERSYFKRKTETGIDEIFYRTGDLVSLRKDGNLMFQGRKDRQIKIRGYRVELDEIEALLLQHEMIKEAATFVIQKEEEKIINAAVILNEKNQPVALDFRTYLGKHLPKYAVPKEIYLLEDFPRTSTGKINRQTLKITFNNE